MFTSGTVCRVRTRFISVVVDFTGDAVGERVGGGDDDGLGVVGM
jgi:hypothetical protein